jgi:hypothetical protein
MDFTWSTPSAGASGINPNIVINGGFDIWQRGTSFTATGKTFTADRWWKFRGGDAAGATYSRQNSATSAPGTQYCMRIQRDNGNTSTANLQLYSDFETNSSIIYAGQTVTLSYYARKGANYSGGDFTLALKTGTGTDQSQYAGFTSETTVLQVIATSASMNTSTFVRYTGTVTLATTMTQLGFQALYNPTGTAGAADYVEITGIKLEEGSSATDFVRAGATIQGELSACQRYYYRDTPGTAYGSFAIGQVISSVDARFIVNLPVQMRTQAASLEYSNVGATSTTHGAIGTPTTFTIGQSGVNTVTLNFNVSGIFTSAGQATMLIANNSTAAYIGFSAEL